MQHLPLFVDIQGRRCLVIGAGTVALRKARLLLRAGACVELLAPEASDEAVILAARGTLQYHRASFSNDVIAGYRLVIAATADEALNRRVAAAAEARNVLCNVVDDREHSSFILPAIVDRDPVVIAVSTGGDAPVLAQKLKSQLEAWLPARIGHLARRAGQWRTLIKRSLPGLAARRRFWQRFFDGPVARDILAGRDGQAETTLRRALIEPAARSRCGEAAIVGAGPGDPGLLTLRAQQLLRRADVVLHDRLVSAPILDMARKEAELIDVGKRAGRPGMRQQEINSLLVDLVRQGKHVCRLKGGDPFVFGRGGEEAAALAAAGLRFEIVPGISAALGCAAYAGIPLTLRGVSRSVTFATASVCNEDSVDWPVLARPGQTLALYMGLGKLAETALQLMQNGLAGSTPAAVVAAGTTNDQRLVLADLASVAARCQRVGITAPAMLFVGDAVAKATGLAWFAPQKPPPQRGRTVEFAASAASARRTVSRH